MLVGRQKSRFACHQELRRRRWLRRTLAGRVPSDHGADRHARKDSGDKGEPFRPQRNAIFERARAAAAAARACMCPDSRAARNPKPMYTHDCWFLVGPCDSLYVTLRFLV